MDFGVMKTPMSEAKYFPSLYVLSINPCSLFHCSFHGGEFTFQLRKVKFLIFISCVMDETYEDLARVTLVLLCLDMMVGHLVMTIVVNVSYINVSEIPPYLK
jgi:hypothetical protein